MKGRTSYRLLSLLDLWIIFLLAALGKASCSVVLITKNESVSFASREADFAPRIRGSGICGYLLSGNPLDACTSLNIKASSTEGACYPFVLVIRGNCSFETKIRHAQDAGFRAVIVFNDEDSSELLTMAGSSEGIWIHAVFITKEAGEALNQYSGDSNTECWIFASSESAPWSIMVISMVSLLVVAAVVATCFIVRRHRVRRSGRPWRQEESYSISPQMVKAMPSVIFKGIADANRTEDTCAICLEDYLPGEKLRILPCCHRFHASCIDSWLTMWRPFCPVCKRDARLNDLEPLASESTPLLSSSVARQQAPVSMGATTQASPPESPPIEIPAQSLDSHLNSPNSVPRSQNAHVASSYQLPPRPVNSYSTSPIVTPYASHRPSLRSLGFQGAAVDPDSLEAFRASPYFTPPSFSRNPSPLVAGTNLSPYDGTPHGFDSQQASPLGYGSYCESPLLSSSPHSPTRTLVEAQPSSD